MTEYDYSPEAYERYMQTQNRIANWVNQTEQHRPEFGKEGGSKPSFFQRLTHRRGSHSAHEPRRRRDSSSSSSSSSSSEVYSKSPRSPGPMPIPSFQAVYPQLQAAPPKPSKPSRTRRRSSSHHQSSHHMPIYLNSPPTSPPVIPYAYPYGTTAPPAQVVSPGPYVYPTKPGYTAVSSPTYMQPSGYFQSQPQTSYPFPTTYVQPRLPQTAPPTIYGQYSQGQTPLASPPAQYPQTAVYPPAIYALSTYGPQQQLPERPVFYQRIFSGSESKKGKKSSRR